MPIIIADNFADKGIPVAINRMVKLMVVVLKDRS
jgi:hypothetical protein